MGVTPWITCPADINTLQPLGTEGELLLQSPLVSRKVLIGTDVKSEYKSLEVQPRWLSRFEFEDQLTTLIRTGDRAKFDRNGNVVWLGRGNTFVEIRGLRISLNEVEMSVRSISDSKRVAVLLYESNVKNKDVEIAVFIECSENGDATIAGKLRSRLVELFPSYIIPSLYIPVDTMPLNASEKIDRQSLENRLSQLSIQDAEQYRPDSKPVRHVSDLPTELQHDASVISEMIMDFVHDYDDDAHEELQGKDFSLDALGLDSIKLSRFAKVLRDKFSKNISTTSLIRCNTTVSQIAEMVHDKHGENAGNSQETDLLQVFDRLRRKIKVPQSKTSESAATDQLRIKTIFLTSITGFLGIHILHNILTQNPDVHVTGLVRAKDDDEAKTKLRRLASLSEWSFESYESRVTLWLGDISKRKLGLKEEHWTHLMNSEQQDGKIDAIIYNAAQVNWLSDYENLGKTNVQSSLEILEAQSRFKVWRLILYVSGGYLSAKEEAQVDIARNLSNASGYDQSKFMSHMVFSEYNSQLREQAPHLPDEAMIVQPGFIIGSQQNGTCPTGDFIWRVALTILQLGAVSQAMEQTWLPIAGVDQIAGVIGRAILMREPNSKAQAETVKILDGVSVSRFCNMLTDAISTVIKRVDHNNWIADLKTDVEHADFDHPFLPVLDWFLTHQSDFLPLDESRSKHGHEQSSFTSCFEEVDVYASLRKSMSYLVKIGFLAKKEG